MGEREKEKYEWKGGVEMRKTFTNGESEELTFWESGFVWERNWQREGGCPGRTVLWMTLMSEDGECE